MVMMSTLDKPLRRTKFYGTGLEVLMSNTEGLANFGMRQLRACWTQN